MQLYYSIYNFTIVYTLSYSKQQVETQFTEAEGRSLPQSLKNTRVFHYHRTKFLFFFANSFLAFKSELIIIFSKAKTNFDLSKKNL